MKARLPLLASVLLGILMASQAVSGCGRSSRTRPPPEDEPHVAPAPPAPVETDPEKILKTLETSVHAGLDCSDCHSPPKDGAKAGEVGKGQCTSCHEEEAKAYAETIHKTAQDKGKQEAASCEDCHGTHDTLAGDDPASTVSQRNTARTCGKCHENPELAKKLNMRQPDAAKHYHESIHGRALAASGLVVAPTCADCHGRAHHIFEAKDPRSTVNRFNVANTCGECHTKAREKWLAGTHAEALKKEALEAGVQLEVGPIKPGNGRVLNGGKHNGKGRKKAAPKRDATGQAPAAKDEKAGAAAEAPVAKDAKAGAAAEAPVAKDAKAGAAAEAPVAKDERAGAAAEAPVAKDQATTKVEPSTQDEPPPAPKPVALAEKADGAKKKAPTCPTCHSAHSIIQPGPRFKRTEDRICGECHEDRLDRYMETYHGRAHALGDSAVAACHDCHGQHDIFPSTQAASLLSKEHRLGTCQKCHVGAPANFADYLAHADYHDKKNYPNLYWAFMAMTGLLVGTFGFFGIHSLMWLSRSLVVRFRDPKGFKEVKQRARKEEGAKLYLRFRPVDRFVHFLVIVSFMLLVITGMPLKFHTEPWATTFFGLIGGAQVAASVHRFAAVVTLTYFVLHIASLIVLLRRHRDRCLNDDGKFSVRRLLAVAFGPDSPFPRWQDAKDVAAHMKYFFGRGPKPKFDRFTYWEKFDYMAVFWGVTVIGLSGLVLWFPDLFTRFLPGWSINVAHIVHSDEALLAAGFIFTFHFFNSHFRPEKFPYDQVMFSGHITEEELKHERPAQFERMAKDGGLDEYRSLGEWAQWKLIINIFGAAAIVLGLTLAAAIFWALLT